MKGGTMNLDDRKAEIKKLALEEKSNGALIYQLVDDGYLDFVISKINDKKTKTNTTCLVKKGYLTGNEQFVDVFCEFLHRFEHYFAPLNGKKIYISMLFEEKAPKFLLCKNYWGDNSFIEYYSFHIKQFLVYNMYQNIKFIYSEEPRFFKGLDITERMSLRNPKHINILFEFMRDMIWCNNYDSYANRVLFCDHNIDIEERLSCKTKLTKEEIIENVREGYITHWEMLIRNYNKYIDCVENLLKSEKNN